MTSSMRYDSDFIENEETSQPRQSTFRVRIFAGLKTASRV